MAKYSNKFNINIGDKFGKWTVISDVVLSGPPNYKVSRTCKCECGTVKDVLEDLLVRGLSKSCGCSNRRYPDIIVGKRYGTLTVLGSAGLKTYTNNPAVERLWKCQCDCGKIVDKGEMDLKMSKNPTCGYPDHDPRRVNKDITKFLNMAGAIRIRCNLVTNNNFTSWGGRGIECELGEERIDIAESLSKVPGWFEGATIDRIDNNGNYTLYHPEHGYEPYTYHDDIRGKDYPAIGNLRWLSIDENNNHKSDECWSEKDFSSRLLSKKGFMHHLGDNFNYDEFIAYETTATNRNGLTCYLFIHNTLKDTYEELCSNFKGYWENKGGVLEISDVPIDVTIEFLDLKTYGKENISFRDKRLQRANLTGHEE